MDLDHAAIALHDVTETLEVLVGELGGEVLHGGKSIGFRALQLRLGDDGMVVELLEPWDVETNDFLERFLARSGDGPHHLTFKSDDIRADLDRVREAGYEPVGVNLANPMWMEAFIHPKQALGTVVQIAESNFDPDLAERLAAEYGGERGPGRWWPEPPPRAPDAVTFRRAVLTVPDVELGLDLYRDLLGGEQREVGEGWIELGWPGGRIRLVERPGGRGGFDRFACERPGPPSERTIGGARFSFVEA